MNKALLSSGKMDWRTPKDFFRELDQEFHFGLDAAASLSWIGFPKSCLLSIEMSVAQYTTLPRLDLPGWEDSSTSQ